MGRSEESFEIRRAPGPATTRLLAIALPTAAFGLGMGVGRFRACRLMVAAVSGLVAASGLAVVLAGHRARVDADTCGPGEGRRRWHDGDTGPGGGIRRVIVLIPARDEAAVIGGILSDLAVQEPVPCHSIAHVMRPLAADLEVPVAEIDVPAAHVEVVVIDDRSRDGTGAAAAAAIEANGLGGRARVVRRAAGPDGKGAALASVPLPATSDTAVVVLDADARVGPSFLACCAAALQGGPGIATARRRMLQPASRGRGALRLANAQDDEQLADDFVQRARLEMGGASELRGDGMVVRADVLAELGGWDARALCEDLDLSARAYLLAGRSVERFPWLEVWEQPVLTPAALVRQRGRWAEGLVRRDLGVVLPAQLDPAIPLRRRLDALGYAFHGIAGWLVAGLALRAVLPHGGRARGLAALLAGTYVASGVVIAGAALSDPAVPGRLPFWRIAGALTLESLWLVALPFGWVRVAGRPSSTVFRQTRHLPPASFAPATASRHAGGRQ